MKTKKQKVRYALLTIACMWIFTGCGQSGRENIDTGMQQIASHQYEEALASFDAAEAKKEDPQLIARGRGIASLGMTDYETAAADFRKALSYSDILVDNLDYDINYYLADAYTGMGENQKAEETYSAILNMQGKETRALFLRGRLQLIDGNYDNAVADFNRAMEYDSANYDLRIEIAGELTQAGYQTEGEKYLSDFLKENEKKLSDYDKGRIYYYLGDYENARVSLEKAKGDNNQNTVLILGKTYEELGDYNYATSVYMNYLADHTDAAVIYNQLGLCKLQSGEYDQALSAFGSAQAVEDNGMEQTLAFNEIVANEYLGNFKQADVLMQNYIKKYPDDEDAKREYIFLQSR